jgi:hypothetical protein
VGVVAGIGEPGTSRSVPGDPPLETARDRLLSRFDIEIGPDSGFGGAASTMVFALVTEERPPRCGFTWT